MIRADHRIFGTTPPPPLARRPVAVEQPQAGPVDGYAASSGIKAPAPRKLFPGTAVLAALTLSMAGLLACPATAVAGQQFTNIEQLTEKAERQIVKDNDGNGRIVRLNDGVQGRGLHLSIHGLGAHPGDMAPVTQRAEARGQTTATFAYNDFHGDQKQNAQSLASELKVWMAEHPGEKVTIETHSLGGRTILAAFHYLQESGEMPKTAIDLKMISPPLAGFGLLNLALPLPIPLAKLIPGAAASRDMASGSGAQELLESVRLPDNVKTTIFYGDNDNLIDYTTKGAKTMAENLNAQVYYLAGEHTTTVPTVASHSIQDFSTEPLAYKPHENRHRPGPPHHH
ncbi:MAG: hypothetical protein J0I12_08080 [Candidatus Eremiobacteraeota bacterium]|nr:hypothetical protein [Candidatus Eremiobacteraeota bacterium]